MAISSDLASITDCPIPALAYGASKAAVNYTAKRIAVEHGKLKVLIIQYVFRLVTANVSPGGVQTGMSQTAAKNAGFDEVPGNPMSVDESASQVIALVLKAEQYKSGTFMDYKGEPMAW